MWVLLYSMYIIHTRFYLPSPLLFNSSPQEQLLTLVSVLLFPDRVREWGGKHTGFGAKGLILALLLLSCVPLGK